MGLVRLVRGMIGRRKSGTLQLVLVIGGVLAAAALRWVIDGGAAGVPFVTFVPVVLLSAVFLDWPFAVLAAVGSLVMVVGVFPTTARLQPTIPNIILWSAFVFIASFMVSIGHVLRRTILDLDARTAQIQAFNTELQHRMKNTLQIVRGLASRSVGTTAPAEFYALLMSRLDALAKANALLGPGSRGALGMTELVEEALAPFPRGAIHVHGPDCRLSGDPGMQLMMALHELGTNATKYGALSVEQGWITIDWVTNRDVMRVTWQEHGGPPVLPPAKKGLGSRILSPGRGLREVDLDFAPQGLVCRIAVDLRPADQAL